jgi:hypothetical protein
MTQGKSIWASKTVWVNALMAIGAILLFATEQLSLTQDQVSAVLFVAGVINIILRYVTTQPIE